MSVTFVIGLPGSGKSTLMKNGRDDNKCTVYDDFLNDFYNNKALKAIESGKNIILIDPRMCIPHIWDKTVKKVEKVAKKNVKLILFENDPENCIKNVEKRGDMKVLPETIIEYSKLYDLSIYTKYECKLLRVYSDP